MNNKMIVIDGVDGSGKGVQTRRLHQALLRTGLQSILTREPGGSPAAEEIRKLLVEGEPEDEVGAHGTEDHVRTDRSSSEDVAQDE